ncbi:MAG: hydrogenase maturation protease [Candidatus Eisenbacteria bacterium]
MPKSVVILGAGNTLAADDGVGVRAVQGLLADPDLPEGVRVFEIGTMGPDALALLNEGEVVVILDAVRGGRRAGRDPPHRPRRPRRDRCRAPLPP